MGRCESGLTEVIPLICISAFSRAGLLCILTLSLLGVHYRGLVAAMSDCSIQASCFHPQFPRQGSIMWWLMAATSFVHWYGRRQFSFTMVTPESAWPSLSVCWKCGQEAWWLHPAMKSAPPSKTVTSLSPCRGAPCTKDRKAGREIFLIGRTALTCTVLQSYENSRSSTMCQILF